MTRKDLDFSWEIPILFSSVQMHNLKLLFNEFDNPQQQLKCIHVAGTNGKGSVCSMMASILQEAGYKVGIFTSPPFSDINDQIKVNQEEITDNDIIKIEREIREKAIKLNKFYCWTEIITLIAFIYFQQQQCDVVIIETVIGGKTDPTNVIVNPLLSIITKVDIDHKAELGNSIEQIAQHKAGIIKDNCPILFGGSDNLKVKNIITTAAKEKKSDYYEIKLEDIYDIKCSLNSTIFSYKNYKNVELTLLGTYQPFNASIVIQAIEILNKQNFIISEQDIYSGLKKTIWKSRFEILNTNPLIIFDGAHNVDGIKTVLKDIDLFLNGRELYVYIVSFYSKEYQQMAIEVSKKASKVYLPRYQRSSAVPNTEFARYFTINDIKLFNTLEEGILAAEKDASQNNAVVICLGAFTTYHSIKDALRKEKKI